MKQFKEIFAEKIISEQISSFSNILKTNECELIFSAIKRRMNRKIKNIKKIYQATKDGGNPSIFHSKCDNINNTLVLIHSSGNKRFGGFTSNIWESTQKELFKDDKNAFVFSLDKQKIYSYKNDGKAIRCRKDYGPCFGYGPMIGIYGNPLEQKKLFSYVDNVSYDFDYIFSRNNPDYAIDYEVFEIIFD